WRPASPSAVFRVAWRTWRTSGLCGRKNFHAKRLCQYALSANLADLKTPWRTSTAGPRLGVNGEQSLREALEDYDQALSIYKQLATDFPNQPDLRNELATTCANLALLHQRQGDGAAAKRLILEGRPHLLAALKANPRHPGYRQSYRVQLGALTAAH